MPDITAQFTLTGEDYEAYLRYYYAHTSRGKSQMRRMYLVGLGIYGAFMALEYNHPRFGIAHPGYYTAYGVITAALIGGGFWYFLKRIWPVLAQGAVRHSGHKGMFTDTSITLRPEALHVRTPEGEGRLHWKSVEGIGADAANIYLFMGGLNAFIIPRRGFDGEATAETAVAQMRALTGK